MEGSHSWSSASVLKTDDLQGSVGSNPTPSAKINSPRHRDYLFWKTGCGFEPTILLSKIGFGGASTRAEACFEHGATEKRNVVERVWEEFYKGEPARSYILGGATTLYKTYTIVYTKVYECYR